MWTLSTLLHNESTFIPLMFAFSFDLTISVQISQFSVASGMKELITLLGAWNRLKKIGMIFPPSEINLGLNTGVRYTPCAESLSLTPKQFLSAQLDLLPSLRSFVRILCKTQAENLSVWLPALCGPDDISGTSLFLLKAHLRSPVDPSGSPVAGVLKCSPTGLRGVFRVFYETHLLAGQGSSAP